MTPHSIPSRRNHEINPRRTHALTKTTKRRGAREKEGEEVRERKNKKAYHRQQASKPLSSTTFVISFCAKQRSTKCQKRRSKSLESSSPSSDCRPSIATATRGRLNRWSKASQVHNLAVFVPVCAIPRPVSLSIFHF